MRTAWLLLLSVALGCGSSDSTVGGEHLDGGSTGGGSSSSGGGSGASGGGSGATGGGGTSSTGGGGGSDCPASPLPMAGAEAVLATEFAGEYSVYLLGDVPGVPMPLGGCVIRQTDSNHLLIAGASESANGGLYSIAVKRDSCNHITGFDGAASLVATTPYIDANILEGADGTLLYTLWPNDELATLPMGATVPDHTTDLSSLGLGSTSTDSPGGLGFVPPPLASKGQLRSVTWPIGAWWHIQWVVSGGTWVFPAAMPGASTSTPLTGNPGGFAYVPAGSPGFPNQGLIVSEWNQGDPSLDRVAVYDVDSAGDPVKTTRKEFFSKFPRPWGAYFEPVTGDYLFLTWHGGGAADSVYLVQGFSKPPPPPELN